MNQKSKIKNQKWMSALLTMVVAIIVSCSGIYDNVEKYASKETIYVEPLDGITRVQIGYERVEIDLMQAGRIPSSAIKKAKAKYTVIECEDFTEPGNRRVIDSVCSWVNVTGLTQLKNYHLTIYLEDEHGNQSLPLKVDVKPFTHENRDALSVIAPTITEFTSWALIEWENPISAKTLTVLSYAYSFTDKSGVEQTGNGIGDKPSIPLENIEKGKEIPVTITYKIIPNTMSFEGVYTPILDTIYWETVVSFIWDPKPDDSFFQTRGVFLDINDVETIDWPKLAHQSNINTITIDFYPLWIRTEKGQKFIADCNKYDIRIVYSFSHALNRYLPRNLFSEDPTMFRMNEFGQRVNDYNMCVHSQRALDVVASNALNDAKRMPEPNYQNRYYFWIDDAAPMCRCPECSKYSDSEQALIIENRIIKELRTFDPNAKLSHLAYANHMTAPRLVKPEEGIFLQYAPIHRRWDRPIDEAHIRYLRENMTVFPVETTEVLEYWLDVSLFSGWKKPAVKVPWNRAVFESDIDTYASFGIRDITTFAVWLDNEYIENHKDISFLKEYGTGLKNFKPKQ